MSRMEPLILVAASGLANEVIEAVRALGERGIVGILDDDETTHGTSRCGVPVLGALNALAEHPGTSLVICAGLGSTRSVIYRRLERRGVSPARYATVIHPLASVPDSCSLGSGTVVMSGVTLTANVTVGDHVVVMPSATLTHGVVIDDFATLCAGVVLGGGVRVGSRGYVGMGAAIRQGALIGADATVGMGAVVLGDVPPNEVWVGNPAHLLSGEAPL